MADVLETLGRGGDGAAATQAPTGAGPAAGPAAAETPGAAAAGAAPAACLNCGEALAGDYCHRCGEKRPEARDLSARHFAAEAAKELTSLDSKLYHTLVALLFRPGRLTNEWVGGRRGRYLKPLNLCLGVFAVNLFVYTASKQATIYDVGLMVKEERRVLEEWKIPGGGGYDRLFAYAGRRRGVPPESLYEPANEKWQRNFSLLQPVQIVLLALLLQLVYFFSGRYFVEHLIFSMHFLSFTALTTTLLWPVFYFAGMQVTGASMAVSLAKFALDVFYLFLALRAVYRGRPALVVALALLVFGGYVVIYLGTFLAALAAALFSVVFG